MSGMIGCAHEYFPQGAADIEVSLVDPESGDVWEEEEGDEGEQVHGQHVASAYVEQSSHDTIQGVESVTGEGGRHDELVVLLVHILVHHSVMGQTVPPVDLSVRQNQNWNRKWNFKNKELE